MDPKKISFGFSKTKKKTTLGPQQLETKEKVDYITSFDGKSAKVPEVKNDLVIPMSKTLNIAERVILKRGTKVKTSNENDNTIITDNQNMSLENLAIQELLTNSKEMAEQNGSNLSIPLAATSELSHEDNDYDNVPVTGFGSAMLRGMGWVPEKVTGKKQKAEVKLSEFRAIGLGLGAAAPEKEQK